MSFLFSSYSSLPISPRAYRFFSISMDESGMLEPEAGPLGCLFILTKDTAPQIASPQKRIMNTGANRSPSKPTILHDHGIIHPLPCHHRVPRTRESSDSTRRMAAAIPPTTKVDLRILFMVYLLPLKPLVYMLRVCPSTPVRAFHWFGLVASELVSTVGDSVTGDLRQLRRSTSPFHIALNGRRGLKTDDACVCRVYAHSLSR